MRVLFVLPEPPLREGRAAGRCAIATVRGLRAQGVDVDVLAARQHFAVAGDPPPDLNATVVDIPPEDGGWRNRQARLRMPRGELSRTLFQDAVAEAACRVDVAHLWEVETAWCGVGLSVPAALELHFLVRLDRSFGKPWRPGFRQVLELELAERAGLRHYGHLVASSPVVAQQLRRRRPTADVVRAPLCLDPSDYDLASLGGTPTAGIIGTASWPPTASAMERLVRRVWPTVKEMVPEARLLVAGRRSKELGLGGHDVEVLGEVDSAVTFIQQLSVLVYPLSRGSGMKVKVMEALACGVPVVTTKEGAEGVNASDGVIVTQTDEELARAAARILGDEAERTQRGAAGRAAFVERFAPAPATAPLVDLYARMVTERTR